MNWRQADLHGLYRNVDSPGTSVSTMLCILPRLSRQMNRELCEYKPKHVFHSNVSFSRMGLAVKQGGLSPANFIFM